MDTDDVFFKPPEPVGRDGDTREKVEAIAGLIEAFITPLTLLVPSRYKADIDDALEKMKEAVYGSSGNC